MYHGLEILVPSYYVNIRDGLDPTFCPILENRRLSTFVAPYFCQRLQRYDVVVVEFCSLVITEIYHTIHIMYYYLPSRKKRER